MNTVIRVIDKTNEWVGKAVSFLLIPLVLITAYEVVMRYIVERPTIWSWDLNIQIFAAIIMLGGGYTGRVNLRWQADGRWPGYPLKPEKPCRPSGRRPITR